jgi:Na+/H+-dicarboxylate symporter
VQEIIFKGINIVKKEKKKIGLSSQIFIGLIGGAIVGLIFNYLIPQGYIRNFIFIDGIFYILGQGFIRLMQMLVVPLVFCSLVCGSMAIGDTKQLGKVGIRTILFYLITTALAITVALTVANIINPGIGLNMGNIQAADNVTVATKTSFSQTC